MLNEAPDDTGFPAEDDDLDGRIAAAATPSKRKTGGFKIDPNEAFIAFPLEFVLDPLPSEPLPALDTVGHNLTQMAETLTTVVKEVYHLRQDLAHQDSFQTRLCDKTNYLAAVVGTPPDDIKVPNVWSAIMELYSQLNDEGQNTPSKAFAHHETLVSKHSVAIVEGELDRARLQRELDGLRSLMTQLQRSLPQLVQDEVGPSVKRIVIQELTPIEGLLLQIQQFLHTKLPNIRATVNHLNTTQINHLSGLLNKAGISHTLGHASQDVLDSLRDEMSEMRAKIAEQQAAIANLEARAEDVLVDIEGEKFPLLTYVSAYCNTHAISPHSLKCVDAMSLMEMVTAMAQNFTDNVESQFRGGHVNMERLSNQKALYSFQLNAPTAFAGQPDVGRANPRTLSAFKSYRDFRGTGSGDPGAAYELQKLINNKSPAFAAEIRSSNMSREGKFLAKTLLDNAKRFLTNLLLFMEKQMKEYGAKTNLSEERRWELIQAVVRIVFNVLSKARRSCSEITVREATTPEPSPELLWAVLHSNRIQKEFLSYNFKNHPSVAPLLTHFLLDVVAFQDDIKPLAKSITQAITDSQQAKRKADTVESQVKNLISKMPPNKKSKGGADGGNDKKGGEAKN